MKDREMFTRSLRQKVRNGKERNLGRKITIEKTQAVREAHLGM